MASSSTEVYEELSDRLERLIEASVAKRRRELPKIGEAAAKHAEEFGDPHLWHLAALAWYDSTDPFPARSAKIYSYENRALKIDPEYQFARQYLAYHQFDEGRYEEALENFSKLKATYFVSLDQRWRVLKNREFVLAARLYLGYPVAEEDYERLFQDYLALDEEDAPVPIELAECLVKLVELGLLSQSRIVRDFDAMVCSLGYGEILSRQLRFLRQEAI